MTTAANFVWPSSAYGYFNYRSSEEAKRFFDSPSEQFIQLTKDKSIHFADPSTVGSLAATNIFYTGQVMNLLEKQCGVRSRIQLGLWASQQGKSVPVPVTPDELKTQSSNSQQLFVELEVVTTARQNFLLQHSVEIEGVGACLFAEDNPIYYSQNCVKGEENLEVGDNNKWKSVTNKVDKLERPQQKPHTSWQVENFKYIPIDRHGFVHSVGFPLDKDCKDEVSYQELFWNYIQGSKDEKDEKGAMEAFFKESLGPDGLVLTRRGFKNNVPTFHFNAKVGHGLMKYHRILMGLIRKAKEDALPLMPVSTDIFQYLSRSEIDIFLNHFGCFPVDEVLATPTNLLHELELLVFAASIFMQRKGLEWSSTEKRKQWSKQEPRDFFHRLQEVESSNAKGYLVEKKYRKALKEFYKTNVYSSPDDPTSSKENVKICPLRNQETLFQYGDIMNENFVIDDSLPNLFGDRILSVQYIQGDQTRNYPYRERPIEEQLSALDDTQNKPFLLKLVQRATYRAEKSAHVTENLARVLYEGKASSAEELSRIASVWMNNYTIRQFDITRTERDRHLPLAFDDPQLLGVFERINTNLADFGHWQSTFLMDKHDFIQPDFSRKIIITHGIGSTDWKQNPCYVNRTRRPDFTMKDLRAFAVDRPIIILAWHRDFVRQTCFEIPYQQQASSHIDQKAQPLYAAEGFLKEQFLCAEILPAPCLDASLLHAIPAENFSYVLPMVYEVWEKGLNFLRGTGCLPFWFIELQPGEAIVVNKVASEYNYTVLHAGGVEELPVVQVFV